MAKPFVPGCMSCDILAGRRTEPGGAIYEDEHWHVGSVISPVVWRGFLIIKLKRHCEHLAELTGAEAAALGPIVQATCQALQGVLSPAKVYVCSFGDGVKHIHLWILPRPAKMKPGMHWVFMNLDARLFLTRRLGIKRWTVPEEKVAEMAAQLRLRIGQLLSQEWGKSEEFDQHA
jgi:diadenosine tetraphosphate (Ap4A) HIT family hydrolase